MYISDYDDRQLRVMYSLLQSYENNEIDLNGLRGSLDFLLNAMESVDEKWAEQFINETLNLEVVNARSPIDTNEDILVPITKEEASARISVSLRKLKELIEEKTEIEDKSKYRLTKIFDKIKDKIAKTEVENIAEYIEYNEYGFALELICSEIYKHHIPISLEDYEIISQVANRLRMEPTKWQYIKELLK